MPRQVDFPLAWSHDGRLIAFRRVYPSTYGPPGIYLISPEGGRPRWLCPATLFFPKELRFSPDDRVLLSIASDYELQLIDVSSGTIRKPLSTNAAVTGGEWIEGGRRILYFRSSYDPEAPADSSWMHVLDLETGEDVHVAFNGRNLSLASMHAGPAGRVAAIEQSSEDLVIVDPSTRLFEIAYDSNSSALYGNVQWWIRPSLGRTALIFEMTSYAGWSITPGEAAPIRFAPGWDVFHMMSPDGETMVTDGTDPRTRVGVLDIASVDDLSGSSHRHLTTFDR